MASGTPGRCSIFSGTGHRARPTASRSWSALRRHCSSPNRNAGNARRAPSVRGDVSLGMAHRLIARYRHLAVALTRLTSRGSVGEWRSPSLCWLGSTASSTPPPTNAARWQSPATSTHPPGRSPDRRHGFLLSGPGALKTAGQDLVLTIDASMALFDSPRGAEWPHGSGIA